MQRYCLVGCYNLFAHSVRGILDLGMLRELSFQPNNERLLVFIYHFEYTPDSLRLMRLS